MNELGVFLKEHAHVLLATALMLLVMAALFATRRRIGTFASVALFFVAVVAFLRFGFAPAIPSSALGIYLAVLLAAGLIYITSSEEMARDFWRPIRTSMTDGKRLPLLLAALLLIPLGVAWKTYASSLPTATPPPKIRTVHPAPPTNVSFNPPGATEAKTIDIITGQNPYRNLAGDQLAAKVAHGKQVYYENCFYCHGDTMSGDGHFVSGVKPPPPANFNDQSVLPMLTETFLFWRISKGGPGLPPEATPFDSTMPQWEKMLSEDDIWSVVLYLYDYTGYTPRSQEHLAKEGVSDKQPSKVAQ